MAEETEEENKKGKKESGKNGFMLNLRNLESGETISWSFVTEYYFAGVAIVVAPPPPPPPVVGYLSLGRETRKGFHKEPITHLRLGK